LADCIFGGISNAKRSFRFVLADCVFLEGLCWRIAFLEGFRTHRCLFVLCWRIAFSWRDCVGGLHFWRDFERIPQTANSAGFTVDRVFLDFGLGIS
jgi:hypothetical protein